MKTRRQFIATTALAFIWLHRYSCSAQASRTIQPFGPLVSDPRRVLDLPKGFSYRILSKAGDPMADGFKVPGKPDGMAAFPTGDGKIVLVRNHELSLAETGSGPFENDHQFPEGTDSSLSHDPGKGGNKPHLGGTSNLVFDPETGETVSQHLSLTGTDRNCAGGPMPWGSWITCEEPEDLTSERGLNHGWCFEVKASATPGLQKAVALKALGRFRHEAVALDPATGILYITEDRTDGLLYRFIPAEKNNLTAGKLQALAIVGTPKADLRNYDASSTLVAERAEMKATWIDMEDVEAPKDDLRIRGHDAGAARFARGEGIHHTPDGIFICCTDGGPSRHGQLFRLRPSGEVDMPDTLDLFLQSEKEDILTNGDNLCPAPWGGLVICEDIIDDSFAEKCHIQCVTPDGKVFSIAANAKDKSEFAGCCFSGDGKWLFVNMQAHGLTLAITGPWEKA